MKKQQSHINVETQSFIIHESTIRMSSLLSDEELGRLIRHFYLYTENGLTPDDEPNLAVTIIFNEWMLRYQSDKEQYETVRQQKSAAGRKSVAKRWKHEEDRTETTEDSTAITEDNTTITENNTAITENNTAITENNTAITEDNTAITEDNTDKQAITKITESDSDSKKKETSPKGEAKKKVSLPPSPTLETRKNDFYQSVVPYAEQYDREMLNDFYQYWTELDKRGRRMRFEMEKTWETGKRLATWARRERKN